MAHTTANKVAEKLGDDSRHWVISDEDMHDVLMSMQNALFTAASEKRTQQAEHSLGVSNLQGIITDINNATSVLTKNRRQA